RADEKLVVVEKLFVALALLAALFTVAQKLVNGFGDGFVDLRGFAFDDADGQAVEKENDVGKDVPVRADDAELELGDGEERVSFRVFEVYVINRRALIASATVRGDAGAFSQELQYLFVVVEQVVALKALDGRDGLVN